MEPANLRFLRRLVTTLMATMILGIIAIFTVLVIQLGAKAPLPLPTHITLPDGKTAASFAFGPAWYTVVTTDNEILVYNRATGELTRRIPVQP